MNISMNKHMNKAALEIESILIEQRLARVTYWQGRLKKWEEKKKKGNYEVDLAFKVLVDQAIANCEQQIKVALSLAFCGIELQVPVHIEI